MFFFKYHFSMDKTPENSTQTKDKETPSPTLDDLERAHEEELQPPTKKQRFEPSYVDDTEWSLPADMADYFVKQCSNFIKPTEIEEHITSFCPPPKNIGKVKLLDSAFKEILYETGKKAIIDQDEVLMNVQARIWDVLGPFSRLWLGMETDKDNPE
eukprot:TCONS_00044058-protein